MERCRRVRKKDQFEMAEDLKLIYRSPNKKIAEMFQQFEKDGQKNILATSGKCTAPVLKLTD